MPDMLARLYDLPEPASYYQRASDAGYIIRRADPWDRERLREFVKERFGPLWAVEADRAFIHQPITAYLATKGGEIAGFAAYECTRRGYFGPTGVRKEVRGGGLGAALLFRCLESMREMGYGYAVIGGVGPAEFYEKTVGAFVIPGSEVGVYASLHELMSPLAGEAGKEQR
jgi:predicted N-acetyltransferase YhbS